MAVISSSPPGTERVINWGGVLKGVAIVTAVVVAAAVAWWAVGAAAPTMTSALAASPNANALLVGAGEFFTWAGGMLETAFTATTKFLGDAITSGVDALGLTGKVVSAEAAGTAIKGAQLAATGAVVAGGVALGTPVINKLTLTEVVPVDHSSAILAKTAAAQHFDHVADLAHDAARHGSTKPFTSRVDRPASTGSFTGDILARREAAGSPTSKIPTPNDSFAKDIAAETAQLKEALR